MTQKILTFDPASIVVSIFVPSPIPTTEKHFFFFICKFMFFVCWYWFNKLRTWNCDMDRNTLTHYASKCNFMCFSFWLCHDIKMLNNIYSNGVMMFKWSRNKVRMVWWRWLFAKKILNVKTSVEASFF